MCFSVRWRPPSVFVFCLSFFGLCFYPVFCGSVFCVKIICFSFFTCFSYLVQASGHYDTRADRRSRPDEAMSACDPKPVNPMVPGSSMNLVSLTVQGRYKIVTRDFWGPLNKLKIVKDVVLVWILFAGHFRLKTGQEAPRWVQEGHQEPQSSEKQHLHKVRFFNRNSILCESLGLLRRA